MFALASILSLVALIISVPIFLVFGLGSSVAAIGGLNLPWSVLIQVSFGALTKHVLIAVPLFIFSGMAMLKGGAALRLVKFATTLVGHWPGGLGVAMVIAMGFFAAFCGSILAAITAVGTIMMPKMIEQGYPTPFVVVLAASAALLEALIPPSNAAILFSALTYVPVSKTFAAGVIPGLILLVLMILLVLFKCRHIKTDKKASFKERINSFISALPALITPIIILGGIYAGFLTPSESAAVSGIMTIPPMSSPIGRNQMSLRLQRKTVRVVSIHHLGTNPVHPFPRSNLGLFPPQPTAKRPQNQNRFPRQRKRSSWKESKSPDPVGP